MAGKGQKGARSKYDTLRIQDRLPEIEGMARDGYRIEDICKVLGIGRQTFHNWAQKYPEFDEAVRRGREVIDAEVENELLNNAMGRVYWEETQELVEALDPETGKREHKMTTVKRVRKYVKPDTTAQIFWLKNRKPEVWRDRQHIAHEGQIGVKDLDYLDDDALDKALKELGGDE